MKMFLSMGSDNILLIITTEQAVGGMAGAQERH